MNASYRIISDLSHVIIFMYRNCANMSVIVGQKWIRGDDAICFAFIYPTYRGLANCLPSLM